MGKKLIIKGADFSENALPVTDLTNLFVWTTGKTFRQVSVGGDINAYLYSSTIFKYSNRIDVSALVGKTLTITACCFTNSSGNMSTYYDVTFLDSDGLVISSRHMEKADDAASTKWATLYSVTIPISAKYLITSFFDDDTMAFSATVE